MNRSYIRYKLEYRVDNETIRKALELAIRKDYETQKQANEVRRHIAGLFPDVTVDIFSISKTTRVRKLRRF